MLNAKPNTIPELYEALMGDIGDLKIGFHAIMLRFDHTDQLLDVIATTVNRHEDILNEHSRHFASINRRLDQHEELLDTLAKHSLHHTEILDRLDPQVKVNEERLGYVERKVARLEFAK